jgi:hypothetical protein
MNTRTLATGLLFTFVLLTGVGLYTSATGHDHEEHPADCPLVLGDMALCQAPLAHLEHWQSALLALAADMLVLVAALVFFNWYSIPNKDPQHERFKRRAQQPQRPTLFQELFAQGLLHPKAP